MTRPYGGGVPTNLRFSLYRSIVGLFTLLSFKTQRVQALRPPVETKARFQPFADAFPEMPLPGVFDAVDFPAADVPRLKRIALTKKMLALAGRIAPSRTDPVPNDEQSFAAAVYPRSFRKAWSRPPQVPTELDRDDVVAALAVQGPFASYLRAEPDGTYTIDLSWMLDYDTAPGLLAPGGRATLAAEDGRLRIVALDRDGDDVPLADWRGRQPERDALLAATERGHDDLPPQHLGAPDDAHVVRARRRRTTSASTTPCAACCTTASTRC